MAPGRAKITADIPGMFGKKRLHIADAWRSELGSDRKEIHLTMMGATYWRTQRHLVETAMRAFLAKVHEHSVHVFYHEKLLATIRST